MLDMARTTHHSSHPIFQQDCAEYMLEVPRRRPRFDWFLFAIVAGIILALAIFTAANLIF
jgi:hypothetical protein